MEDVCTADWKNIATTEIPTMEASGSNLYILSTTGRTNKLSI